MNGNQIEKISLCNNDDNSRNLPLKKRRNFFVESTRENEENRNLSKNEQVRFDLNGAPTPPASPPNEPKSSIDEHFRKSLGKNYENFHSSFSNNSSRQQTPTESIEEHFQRSLAKFFTPWANEEVHFNEFQHRTTEDVVDDHFAKALGPSTWQKLKDQSN